VFARRTDRVDGAGETAEGDLAAEEIVDLHRDAFYVHRNGCAALLSTANFPLQ